MSRHNTPCPRPVRVQYHVKTQTPMPSTGIFSLHKTTPIYLRISLSLSLSITADAASSCPVTSQILAKGYKTKKIRLTHTTFKRKLPGQTSSGGGVLCFKITERGPLDHPGRNQGRRGCGSQQVVNQHTCTSMPFRCRKPPVDRRRGDEHGD